MKKVLATALMTVFLASAGFSADNTVPQDKLNKAIKAFQHSLKAENNGVRHSALHVIAKLKSDYPNINLDKLDNSLLRVAKKDKDAIIRAHANLTYLYLNNNELVSKVKVTDPENPMSFFNDLHNELYEEFLSLAF